MIKNIMFSSAFIIGVLGATTSSYAITCGTNKDCLDKCTQGFEILIPICLVVDTNSLNSNPHS